VRKPVVIIGSTGQLGSDLMASLAAGDQSSEIVGLAHSQIEVAGLESVRIALNTIRPGVVINTSAYHKVDDVEENPGKAFEINAIGPRNLAAACKELDAVLIHMSTDYVFSGSKGSAYVESDPVDPINTYGISKAAGEMFVRHAWRKHFIVRTSGLYGVAGPSGKGTNFVGLMLNLAASGKPIKVVDDQVLTPTPTHILARQIIALSQSDKYGTYHATCQGQCSWFEFARAIFEFSGVSPDLNPQTTAQSGAKASRPSFSVLENQNLGSQGIDLMPTWQAGLREYLGRIGK
jgi:dTDP-4-dehydrorhamnose reductase